MVTVSRAIGGVHVNPQEYLLNRDGSLMTFESEDKAIAFMKSKSWNDDAIEFLLFEEVKEKDVKNFFK
jgi:hypothetical protein